ncbi:MAG: hypothetical protein WD895_04605 [Acidimicrobiia bacterium]
MCIPLASVSSGGKWWGGLEWLSSADLRLLKLKPARLSKSSTVPWWLLLLLLWSHRREQSLEWWDDEVVYRAGTGRRL